MQEQIVEETPKLKFLKKENKHLSFAHLTTQREVRSTSIAFIFSIASSILQTDVNPFSPIELACRSSSVDNAYSGPYGMSKNGMIVINGSGIQGFWEIDVTNENVAFIGLSTGDWQGLDFYFITNPWKGVLWLQNGRVSTKVCSTKPIKQTFHPAMAFKDASVLAILVCCLDISRLHFFRDGVKVHTMNLPFELHGRTLFPCGPRRCEGVCAPLKIPNLG